MDRTFLPLIEVTAWMKFVGVVNIVIGAISVLTVIGILWGWAPIWLGYLLFSAASRIRAYDELDSDADLELAFDKLGLLFKLYGIFTLIGLSLVALIFVILIVLLSLGAFS